MKKNILQKILDQDILSITPLSGGDIAKAQKISTASAVYFVKSISLPNASQLIEKEKLGLEILRQINVIKIPEVIGIYTTEMESYLILEFIEEKQPNARDMQEFGQALAQMHLKSRGDSFGLNTNNFIGKLSQINTFHSNWAEFYVLNRILPQLNMASTSGLLSHKEIPSVIKMVDYCKEIFGEITPSLLHGDLWNGNYLISTNSEPYLIDPAVYYGHNEVDLAMTKLFGGFPDVFYEAYHEILPHHKNQEELVEVYQLYYLLVHLNLFGLSYKKSCLRILRNYFN